MEVMNSGTVGGHITNITFSAGSWAAILHSPFHAMAYLHIFKNISIFYIHHLAIWSSLCPLVPFPKTSLLPWSSD